MKKGEDDIFWSDYLVQMIEDDKRSILRDTVWENQSHSDSDGGQFCPNLCIIAIFVWKMKSQNILGSFKKFHILWDIENTYFYDITGQFSTYFHHAIDYFTASGTFSRRKVQY